MDDSNIVVCKNLLNNIIKNKINNNHMSIKTKTQVFDTINDVVFRTNKIVFHTYNFIKLYFIHLYESNLTFPIIDVNFVYSIMNVISVRSETRCRHISNEKQLIIDGSIL